MDILKGEILGSSGSEDRQGRCRSGNGTVEDTIKGSAKPRMG